MYNVNISSNENYIKFKVYNEKKFIALFFIKKQHNFKEVLRHFKTSSWENEGDFMQTYYKENGTTIAGCSYQNNYKLDDIIETLSTVI